MNLYNRVLKNAMRMTLPELEAAKACNKAELKTLRKVNLHGERTYFQEMQKRAALSTALLLKRGPASMEDAHFFCHLGLLIVADKELRGGRYVVLSIWDNSAVIYRAESRQEASNYCEAYLS